MIELKIEGLSHDGRGVGRNDGKAVFVSGAVPGDWVQVRITEQQKNFDNADLIKVLEPSAQRAEPFCALFGECGGCQYQHFELAAQRHWKALNFFNALRKAVNLKKCEILEPIVGEGLAYRRRARLVLGRNKSDKEARLGFRALGSNEVIDVPQCPVLSPALNQAIQAKREHLLTLASRNLKEITLVESGNKVIWSGVPIDLTSDATEPTEALGQYDIQGLSLDFPAEGFIQVNASLNEAMVAQAIDWLSLKPDYKVLDLFCGVGNFTLPLAKQVAQVTGIEGDLTLVQTAKHNAERLGIANSRFFKANLFEEQLRSEWFLKQTYDAILLDPGRQGAQEVCQHLGKLNAQRIVYVSCNASTLIRDVQWLEKQGYECRKANLIDMFPHTTHTEVMVQLVKTAKKSQKKPSKIFKL
ncbi:23S rRNA (uracil(1939)-C(5))-methyltransferase RlmD [Thiosulfativibrio zosterae]|uniref:23S rRNA (Uracil(1939)-C(5))-methyltransferase RlmD n=1 Tax=Thiosulfativibrio zosterae TaxID=2675053 RepID=A0A6F8PR69_9GAMM|nr:23S rRNA (uracil(1939)-C(5))-methyltransferase RlmD [Thiosulfativibrio zosterae]BBP44609.1 23S rRNA (uracil(1939)-C(5))-methyltransferase RlmD [Thiosulfativibrio zosterae]